MRSYPRITIITPSYNQGEFLERTIRSVLDQEYPNLEYLIFDGGSEDRSVDIIKKYERQLTYWESQPDRGQSHAINKGLQRASGDIIGWLNSDDTLLPSCLEKVVTAFESNPQAGAVYGNFCYIDEKDRILRKRHVFRSLRYETLLFHDYLGQPAVFFKKEAVRKTGLLDEKLKFAMDWDFFLRMLRNTKMAHINSYIATYRVHKTSKTTLENIPRYKADLAYVHKKNRIPVFATRILDAMYFRTYKVLSLVERLIAVVRDNPFDYFRVLKHVTKGHLLRGILLRVRYY